MFDIYIDCTEAYICIPTTMQDVVFWFIVLVLYKQVLHCVPLIRTTNIYITIVHSTCRRCQITGEGMTLFACISGVLSHMQLIYRNLTKKKESFCCHAIKTSTWEDISGKQCFTHFSETALRILAIPLVKNIETQILYQNISLLTFLINVHVEACHI